MKTKEKRTLDIPEPYKEYFDNVTVEYRRKSFTSGSDHIEIHLFQPDGAEQHRYSEFKIVDETEREVAFLRSNHNHPEPYRMALFGLNLAGWETNKNWELDHTDRWENRAKQYRTLAGRVANEIGSGKYDGIERHVLADIVPRLFVCAILYEFELQNDQSLTEFVRSEGLRDGLAEVELQSHVNFKDETVDQLKAYLRDWGETESLFIQEMDPDDSDE